MTSYASLDVSQQATQVCVVDARGAVMWTGKVPSEPLIPATRHTTRPPHGSSEFDPVLLPKAGRPPCAGRSALRPALAPWRRHRPAGRMPPARSPC